MKRLLLALFIIVMAVGLLLPACAPQPTAPPAPSPTASSPSPTTAAPSPTSPATTPGSSPTATKPAQTYNLSLAYHFSSRGFPHTGVLIPWIDQIQKDTNGRVRITPYPGATMVGQEQDYDAVSSGVLDIVCYTPSTTPGRFPVSEVVDLPKLFTSGEQAGRAFEEILQKYAVNTELKDVKYLYSLMMSPMPFASNKPVKVLEDFKGMKIRIEGKIDGWITEAVGASGIFVPTPEIYNSLERGLLQGVFFAYEGQLALALTQVTKYRTEANMTARGHLVVMNKNTWNRLPPDIQAVFMKYTGADYTAATGKGWDGMTNGTRAGCAAYDKKVGNPEINFLSPEEDARWTSAVKPVWDKWANELQSKGLAGKAILEDALALAKKYAK